MEREELRSIQAPLKERYAVEPEAAVVMLYARGTLGEGVSCSVDTGRALAEAVGTLLKLTERYCVVFQTLSAPPELSASLATGR